MSDKIIFEPDGAGFIYPYVKSKDWNTLFRVEFELDTQIDINTLKKAVLKIRNRFPSFFVRLVKKGSEYIFESTDSINGMICIENKTLCKPMDFDKIPLRLTVWENRLGFEIFHAITDGHGSIIFMQSLIACYYEILNGEKISGGEIKSSDEPAKDSETENAFIKAGSEGTKKVNRFGIPAYQYKSKSKRSPLSLVNISVDSNELYKVAKKHNTTVTTYLTAVYIYTFLNFYQSSKLPIKISVPVDLRKIFNSDSVRNFSLFSIVGINPREKEWTVDEIIESISEQFKTEINRQIMADMAYTNISSEHSPVIRKMPMPIKKMALKIGYNYFGEALYTSTISNIGKFKLPDELEKHINDIKVFIGEAMVSRINLTCITFKDNLNLMFTNNTGTTDAEKFFGDVLKSEGLEINITKRDDNKREFYNI